VAWPHFADQQPNADSLVEAGVAITLWGKMRMSKKIDDMITFKQPIFDAAKITKIFNEIMDDPKYRNNM